MVAHVLRTFVSDHREELLELAQRRLNGLIRDRPEDQEGMDHLPTIIDELIRELEPANEGHHNESHGEHEQFVAAASEHGVRRAYAGIPIQIVVHDYGVICDAVAELAKEQREPVSAADWQVLNRTLDVGIAAAIGHYEDELRGTLQRKHSVHVGSVAHEIRNALASVTTAYDAIKRGRVGQRSRTAEILERGLARLNELASQLLGESKVTFGGNVTFETVELHSFLHDLIEGLPRKPDVAVRVEVASDLRLHADKHLLTAALGNLVSNALKFTQADTEVEVRAQVSQADDDHVTIEVEDRCGGLPAELLDGTLFRPFAQGTGDPSGVGLGLSIVHDAVEASRGSVAVRNRPGQGCVFAVSFPRRRE
ncbi:MAG TPA: HAMP domain-containing sensor histidine kinase [Polyangia bacterium]|jgi:hypothetical protein